MIVKDELYLLKEINNIIDNFDFEKVHRVMKFLDWRIKNDEDKIEVPSVSQLIKEARIRLIDAAELAVDNGECMFSHSGPFKARAYYDKTVIDENPFSLELLFVVEDSFGW